MVKSLPANAQDTGLSPGSGRSPGGGNGNPLQYSCLRNPLDRGNWQATVHGVAKSQTGLSNRACTINIMCLNHPETIPPHPQSVEKLSSANPVSGAENVGDHGKDVMIGN